MAETIKKAKLAAEDIHFDAAGTGSTISILKSDGNFRSGSRINAGHIPSKTATRGKLRIGGTTPTAQTEVDGHLEELYGDLYKVGEPDSNIFSVASGVLGIATGGITSTHLKTTSGSEAVTTNSIQDDAVTNPKIGTAAVVGSGSGASGDNVIQAATIGPTELGTAAVEEAKIADAAVTETKIADAAVTTNKLDLDGTGNNPPAYFAIFGGTANMTATGTNTHSEAVTGVLTTDLVMATVKSYGAGPSGLESAGCNINGTITFVLNANQTGSTTVIQYVVFRATVA